MLIQDASTRLVTYEPYATLSLQVAEAVKQQLRRKPDSKLGLPTGRTPTETYKVLSQWTTEGALNWSKATVFQLDEYYGVPDSVSFRYYLQTNLFDHINLPANSQLNPILCDNYDALIANRGGLDLTVLGIGTNGHIAFNEPGTPEQSWTHSIWLTESTKQANAEFFKGAPPSNAVTMGIQTILSSRQIILMVSGTGKKTILTEALRGPISPNVPASFLQLHKNLVVMTDFEY